MSFFAILFALLLEQVRPPLRRNAVHEAAQGWARWCSRTMDTGANTHGWLAWGVIVLVPAASVLILHWLLIWGLGWPGVLLTFVLHASVLYATLGFRQFSHHFTAIREALDAGDEVVAREGLAAWKQVETSELPRSEITRHVIEHSVLAAHRHVFAVLGWYALLAGFGLGPAGALVYRMSEFANRYFARRNLATSSALVFRSSEALSLASQTAWYVIDYLPARLSALGFAIVGNFEDAIDSWRNFSQRLVRSGLAQDMNENDGVILAATSGAINIRLGSDALKGILSPLSTQDTELTNHSELPLHDSTNVIRGSVSAVPDLQSVHLKVVVGLVWRCVVLWMLLLALLTLARLLG